MITTLDKFGRVIVPKKLRKALGINTEDTLNISEDGERIILERVKEKVPVVNRNGLLVFTGNLEKESIDLVKDDRQERMRKLLTAEDDK